MLRTLSMALETIFVAALFFAHFAIPFQAAEAFGLHLVVDPFWRTEIVLWHLGKSLTSSHFYFYYDKFLNFLRLYFN